MRRTILDTPVLTPILVWIAAGLLKIFRWRAVGPLPDAPKYVMIAAPHTSNLDAILLLMLAGVLRLKLFWLGKDTLFRFPFGGLMRWFGGIPVDRSRRTDMVTRLGEIYRQADELVIVVPPEATRSRSDRWKTGFYHIAVAGGVPIGLGYLDYGRREGGVGPLFEPTGDLETDLVQIREFYADKKGLHEAGFGEIRT